MSRRAIGIAAIAAVALTAAPLVLAPYAVTTLTRIVVFALLAMSLDLLVGFTGLPSLGHGAYFGAGAYAAGWVAIHATASAPVVLAASLAAGAVLAAIAGLVAVRARGVFFLMLTLAIGEIVEQWAESWHEVTGGSNGLYGIPPARLGEVALVGDQAVYWAVLAVAAAAALGLRLLVGSPLGAALRGVRDNEPRMRALGYRVGAVKLFAFTVAGAVAGLAGGLLAAQQRLVTPSDLGLGTSIPALLAVTIGGPGTLWGACAGAALVVILRDTVGAGLGGHGQLLLGAVFVAAVYLLPGGAAGARWRRRRR